MNLIYKFDIVDFNIFYYFFIILTFVSKKCAQYPTWKERMIAVQAAIVHVMFRQNDFYKMMQPV